MSLRVLASAEGAVVSKDELMTRLWPGRTVAENDLHVYISALRKALDEHGEGDTYIITVPGRGYRLADPSGAQRAGSSEPSPAQPLPPTDKPSIAVLPFANLSADPEQEYFSDGVADDIITALSRYPSLLVIARNSFSYKNPAVDVKRVGRRTSIMPILKVAEVAKRVAESFLSRAEVEARKTIELQSQDEPKLVTITVTRRQLAYP